MAGEVWIDDRMVDKAGQLVAGDVAVRVEQGLRYVSRGGLKLEKALHVFGVSPQGWVCADVGASTGGFTDCLLQHGAAKVYAIDVGYGQLAWQLRQDARVVVIERANIRHLEALPEPAELAVVDVSFIGLGLVLPRIASLLGPAGQIIVLIKPQFEVGKGAVGKGGVVREPRLHRYAVEKVLNEAAALGLAPAGLVRSPITGPAGNVEFLALLRSGGEPIEAGAIEKWLQDAVEGSV